MAAQQPLNLCPAASSVSCLQEKCCGNLNMHDCSKNFTPQPAADSVPCFSKQCCSGLHMPKCRNKQTFSNLSSRKSNSPSCIQRQTVCPACRKDPGYICTYLQHCLTSAADFVPCLQEKCWADCSHLPSCSNNNFCPASSCRLCGVPAGRRLPAENRLRPQARLWRDVHPEGELAGGGAAPCKTPVLSCMQRPAMPPTRHTLADSLLLLWRVLPAETGATRGCLTMVLVAGGGCGNPLRLA